MEESFLASDALIKQGMVHSAVGDRIRQALATTKVMIIDTCFTSIRRLGERGTVRGSIINTLFVSTLEVLARRTRNALIFARRVVHAGNGVRQTHARLQVKSFFARGARVLVLRVSGAIILRDFLAHSVSIEETVVAGDTLVLIVMEFLAIGNRVRHAVLPRKIESLLTRNTAILHFLENQTIGDRVRSADSVGQEKPFFT